MLAMLAFLLLALTCTQSKAEACWPIQSECVSECYSRSCYLDQHHRYCPPLSPWGCDVNRTDQACKSQMECEADGRTCPSRKCIFERKCDKFSCYICDSTMQTMWKMVMSILVLVAIVAGIVVGCCSMAVAAHIIENVQAARAKQLPQQKQMDPDKPVHKELQATSEKATQTDVSNTQAGPGQVSAVDESAQKQPQAPKTMQNPTNAMSTPGDAAMQV